MLDLSLANQTCEKRLGPTSDKRKVPPKKIIINNKSEPDFLSCEKEMPVSLRCFFFNADALFALSGLTSLLYQGTIGK